MNKKSLLSLLAPLGLLLAACGGEDSTSSGADRSAGASPFRLEASPGDPVSIQAALAAHADAGSGAAPAAKPITIEGRVRRRIPGQAMLVLYDLSLKYCGQDMEEGCGCVTPWDYC